MEIPGYTLNSRLAEGGCAEIYAGLDHASGKLVAIKILHPRNLGNKVEIKRLQDEAALAQKLTGSDNIVQVFKHGYVGKVPYIVMEYIQGKTLRELVSEKKLFGDIELLKLAKGLCRAIRAIHGAGIVHKDIKPDNVMITSEGRVKLIDFGFAENSRSFSLFGGRRLEGSAAYMAPEMFVAKKATEASDIYALGCTLYEAAAGAPPFTGQSHSEIIGKQTNMALPATALSRANPKISILTEKTVMTAIQKDVNRRFKSVDEMLLDLARNQSMRSPRGSGSQRLAVSFA